MSRSRRRIKNYYFPLEEVMTLREAADTFGVNFRTLHSARDDGRLHARKSGNVWLVTRTSVRELLDSDRTRVKADGDLIVRKGNKMNLEQAVNQMKGNTRHGATDVPCPECGKTVRVQWAGGWTKSLNAECIGEETGWLRWENACGFELSGLDTNTVQMEKALSRMPHAKRSPDELRHRRMGRGTLWPSPKHLEED